MVNFYRTFFDFFLYLRCSSSFWRLFSLNGNCQSWNLWNKRWRRFRFISWFSSLNSVLYYSWHSQFVCTYLILNWAIGTEFIFQFLQFRVHVLFLIIVRDNVISTWSWRFIYVQAFLQFLLNNWFLMVIQHGLWVRMFPKIASFLLAHWFLLLFRLFIQGVVFFRDNYILIVKNWFCVTFEHSYWRDAWFLVWACDFGVLSNWVFKSLDFQGTILSFAVLHNSRNRKCINLSCQNYLINTIGPSIHRITKCHDSRTFNCYQVCRLFVLLISWFSSWIL